MKGEGKFAEQIKTQFAIARKLYLKDMEYTPLDYSLFDKHQSNQMRLF
jgi:hypothetical protein